MRPQKVVVGDKQGDERYCAIPTVEPMGRFHMMLEGPVQPFNQLLENPIGFRLAVQVLESYHLPVGKVLFPLSIEEVDARRVGRVPIGDKDDRLFRIGRPDSFVHSNDGRQCLPAVGHMVGGDLQILGREEKEDILLFPHDLDVRLIACADVVDTPLMREIEAMAIKRSRSGIVQN